VVSTVQYWGSGGFVVLTWIRWDDQDNDNDDDDGMTDD